MLEGITRANSLPRP